jgi:site-specific DNA-methyltransferase (adenine-specific)
MSNNWQEKFLNKILCGDSYYILQEIPDNSINLIITSPPYFRQRNYGKGIGNEKKLEEYIDNLLKIFKECVRVTREDGSIVFNLGDKYDDGNLLMVPYRFAFEALKNNPIMLVNIITWVKSNPTPRQFKRRLVSSTEPFFHFVKSKSYYYNLDGFLSHLNFSKNRSNSGSKIGQKYFELIEIFIIGRREKNGQKRITTGNSGG